MLSRAVLSLLFLPLLSAAQQPISWSASAGLDNQEVRMLSVPPGRPAEVWAAAPPIGIFRSRDAGASWQLKVPGDIRKVLARDDILLAAYGCELRRSTDGGTTWAKVLSKCVDGLTATPEPGPLFAVSTVDVYVSRDRGATWTAIPSLSGPYLDFIDVSPHDPNIVIAGGGLSALYRSTDGGATFVQTTLPKIDSAVFDRDHRGVVIAAGNSLLYRSTDFGQSWTTLQFRADGSTSYVGTILVLYSAAGTGRVFAGGSFGVAQSADGGATWSVSRQGIVQTSPSFSPWVQTMAVAGNRIVAGTWRSDTAAFPAGGYFGMMVNVTPPLTDADGDGSPDFSELDNGTDPFAKDNNVFADTALGRRLFVQQQYRDFLGREGDSAGVAQWSSAMLSGSQTRESMADAFLSSAEFQASVAPIARLYFATYLRIPDAPGLLYWAGQLKAGASLQTVAQVFASAPEFAARYGSLDNRGYVAQLYANVLGRAGDEPGIAFWTSQLSAGLQTRGSMLSQFSQSAEYVTASANSVYVTMVYIGMLRREPDQAGFDFWKSQVASGAGGARRQLPRFARVPTPLPAAVAPSPEPRAEMPFGAFFCAYTTEFC